MHIWKIAAVELLLFTTYHGVNSIQCLSCDNIRNGRDCTELVTCGPHEVCFHTQIIAQNGNIYRNLGCRESRQCAEGFVGKREEKRTGEVVICDQCCNQTWCQTTLCGDQDYDSNRGVICYHCPSVLPEQGCSHIIQCALDDVCFESLTTSATATVMLQTGCFSKQACSFANTIDRNTTGPHCWNCCSRDLCNSVCEKHEDPSVAGPCIDRTPNATCTIAHTLVCTDRIKAQHAGCMHHCGFC